MAEGNIGDKRHHAEQPGQCSCGEPFQPPFPPQSDHPSQHICAPENYRDNSPAPFPPKRARPCQNRCADSDERRQRHAEIAMLVCRHGVVVLPRRHARVHRAVEVHIDPLPAFEPLFDIRLVRSIARLERKGVPDTGEQHRQQQRQRRPARQTCERPFGQGHALPRADCISDVTDMGTKASPTNIAGATTAPQ